MNKILQEEQSGRMQGVPSHIAMNIGITISFHSVPGSGKTETIYQITRQTGQNIFKVDISQTRDM